MNRFYRSRRGDASEESEVYSDLSSPGFGGQVWGVVWRYGDMAQWSDMAYSVECVSRLLWRGVACIVWFGGVSLGIAVVWCIMEWCGVSFSVVVGMGCY